MVDIHVHVCCTLGIFLAIEKLEGPLICLVFLGIVIDTILQELRLPEEKLRRLRELVQLWLSKKRCTNGSYYPLLANCNMLSQW